MKGTVILLALSALLLAAHGKRELLQNRQTGTTTRTMTRTSSSSSSSSSGSSSSRGSGSTSGTATTSVGVSTRRSFSSSSGIGGSSSSSTSTTTVTRSNPFGQSKKKGMEKDDPSTDNIDVFCLVDITEVNTKFIKELSKGADTVVNGLFNASGRIRIGLGIYEDKKQRSKYETRLPISKNLTKIIAAISGLKAVNASIKQESQLAALETVAKGSKIGFRKNSTKVIVWIGNGKGADPSRNSTETTVAKALKKKSIRLLTIDTGRLDAGGQASRITSGAKGLYYKVTKKGKFTTISIEKTVDNGKAKATTTTSGGGTGSVEINVNGERVKTQTPVSLVRTIVDGVVSIAGI